MRGLAVDIKGDTSVAELARVFRLPGTVNTKPDRGGALCEVVFNLWGHEYDLADFAEYRALVTPIKKHVERDLPRHRPDDLPRYIRNYLDTPTPDGSGNRELNNAAYYMHANGYTQSEAEQLLVSKAMSDGYPERPAIAVIRSVFNAAPGDPSYMRPSTLAVSAIDSL